MSWSIGVPVQHTHALEATHTRTGHDFAEAEVGGFLLVRPDRLDRLRACPKTNSVKQIIIKND